VFVFAAPTVIFFDEIDALAGKRGGGDSRASERVLSQLLTGGFAYIRRAQK
jgi:SpoVK/Ycf46/Vps4 family AAA+-type ATPase